MTETEQLARTVRFIVLGVVGLAVAVAAIAFVGLRAGVRWGWDAATTDRAEKVTQCVEQVEGYRKYSYSSEIVGTLGALNYCSRTDGDVAKAKALVRTEN